MREQQTDAVIFQAEKSEKQALSHIRPKEAALVVIGGLLTGESVFGHYKRLLKSDTTSTVETKERFVPPPRRGLGFMPEIHEELMEKLEQLYKKLGARMFLVGHSIGGLLATMTALKNPDIVTGVVCVNGAQEGIKQETLASLALKGIIRKPQEAKLLRHDSKFMTDHKQQIAEEWPEYMPLHLVLALSDYLIVPPQGLRLMLPNGRSPERLVVAPPLPGIETAIRLIPGMPQDVKALKTWYPTEHINGPRAPVVISYINESRKDAKGIIENATRSVEPVSLMPDTPAVLGA